MDLNFLSKLNKEMTERFPLLKPIENVNPDGSVNRFDSIKENDNAVWLCVHENNYKGNIYLNAVFGNWREGVQYTCSSYDPNDKAVQSKEFKAATKKQLKETQERLDREKAEKHEYCRKRWTPFYYGLPQNAPVHEYLKNKKINSNFHARVCSKGVLFVPAWNSSGVFVGGQQIFLDPETDKFSKKMTYGIELKGSFCPMTNNLRTATFVILCEGFATAASVAMAFKDKEDTAVVALWNTSNLLPGAQAVRRVNPNSYLVFAADRDVHTNPKDNNVGERKAKYAANKLSNAIVKTVQFEIANDKWSDYNDLHQFEGLDKVRAQLDVDNSDFEEMVILGYDEKDCYMFSTRKKTIICFKPSELNPSNLIYNASSKYWGERYGFIKDKDGENTMRPDWNKVIEGIGSDSGKAGNFKSSKIRGVGAWNEGEEIAFNLGDKVYYKGEILPLHNNGMKSEHFYQSGPAIAVDFNRPIGNSSTIKIVEAFQMLQYKNPSDFIIVLGWIFTAQIFAALPWRPHIWFTGPRGSGKSTILEYINRLVNNAIITQNSTASGIRQELKNNAFPIITDEAEPNTEADRKKLAELLLLARQSSTRSSYKTLRGSASGASISYNTNTCFCMGSIQLSSMGGADTSRFFTIEMKNIKGQSHQDFVRLENAMAEIANMGSGLMVRAIKMYKNHVKNIETAKRVIKERKIESRQADQLAPIIAGYWAYFSTDIMEEGFVTQTISELNFENSDYAQANEINDSEKCLDDIMGLQIPGRSITVGQMVERLQGHHSDLDEKEYGQLMGMIGLKYLRNEKALFVASRSSALKNHIEKVSDFSDYSNVLRRHDNFIDNKTLRISGSVKKGMIIGV